MVLELNNIMWILRWASSVIVKFESFGLLRWNSICTLRTSGVQWFNGVVESIKYIRTIFSLHKVPSGLPAAQIKRERRISISKINQVRYCVLIINFVDSFAHECLIVLGANNNNLLARCSVVKYWSNLERQEEREWTVTAWLAILFKVTASDLPQKVDWTFNINFQSTKWLDNVIAELYTLN